ncbi:MAG: tetratricopeptide repeat protein [Chloroflexi bacterium]|nr:tetratricopeptide repeat protein [Chloroflexota bacterium]
MESSFAITKLIVPSKRTNLFHRSRLVDFLHAHIERKLLLVSASAGYGKTSLLIDFAHETALPVCWYALDASDADPKVFLQSIIASLRRQFPNFGARTLELVTSASFARDVEVIVGTLINEIVEGIPNYFVLVLDDYHIIEESVPVNNILDTFLRLAPENAHLIISGRTLPAKLTLTRLTAQQQIAGLGVNDLRFTADEIRTLIQQNYQIDLSQAQAEELVLHSEGWITGILLTTHTLWKGLFQDLVRLQGPQSSVFEYLANEVFAQQPHELQQFLLHTSILDGLDPTVCDELLNISNAAEMLHRIEQKNLFILRLEQEQTWYRYHHLFQEFLRSRLRQTDVEQWRNLNCAAAKIFEKRQAYAVAISHYLTAQFFDDAAQAIEGIAQSTFDAGLFTTLIRWIDALPPSNLDQHPNLIVMRAMIYSENGEQAHALILYDHATALFEKSENPNGIGKILVHQAVSLRFLGRYQEAIDSCSKALKLLAPNQTEEIVRAHRSIGACYTLFGNLSQATTELETALRICEREKDFTRIAWLYHELGVTHRMMGSAQAEKYFQQAMTYWRELNNAMGLATTLNSVGVSYHRQGKYTQAIETLEQAREQSRRAGHLRFEAYALASLGDVYRDESSFANAQDAYQNSYELAKHIDEGFIIVYTLTALGELYRQTGDYKTAETLLQQAAEQASNHRSNYEQGLIDTALGILDCQKGALSNATKHLTQAVTALDKSGAKHDSARARFHLANAYWLDHNSKEAETHIRQAIDLAKDLREDQFIVADGAMLLPLLQYAISKKIASDYVPSVINKINARSTKSKKFKTTVADESALPRLEAYAFGTAQLNLGGRAVTTTDWDSTTAKELFFLLLAHPEGLRKDQIVDMLWRDMDTAKANGIFHSTVYRVRRAVFAQCIVYENGAYHLNPEIDLWSDVVQFNRLLDQVQSTSNDDERASFYRAATALYRGDYYEDSYNDWSSSIRNDLLQKFILALTRLATYYDRQSNLQAIETYQKILQKDAYREDIYRALMRFQSVVGDRTSALKTFQQCAKILQDEMGVAPSTETQTLYEEILKTQH